MNIYFKSLLYLSIYVILHYGYELTHWAFLAPFCGINESVFQHLKMAFWAYLLASVIEYLVVRRKFNKRETFWYPRLISTTILPYFTMLIWYLAPAIFGRIEFLLLEVAWATFSTYFSAVIAGRMERNIEEIKMNSILKIIILILFIVSAFLFVRFTYKPPWIDLFIDPEAL